VDNFIRVCVENDALRRKPAFLLMCRRLHGLFETFVKRLPGEEDFMDICENAYDSWRVGNDLRGGK
jgi:hypothetical protein